MSWYSSEIGDKGLPELGAASEIVQHDERGALAVELAIHLHPVDGRHVALWWEVYRCVVYWIFSSLVLLACGCRCLALEKVPGTCC